jgi:hypothetical protein
MNLSNIVSPKTAKPPQKAHWAFPRKFTRAVIQNRIEMRALKKLGVIPKSPKNTMR